MQVAVIGLGDIATKAYLPVLAADPGLEPVLVTRRADVRDRLAAAYQAPAVETVAQALALGVEAAFVHVSTSAHAAVVETLLRADVPTFVDKPIADSDDAAAALVELAERRAVSLFVGFNRRYAPEYDALQQWPERDVAILHKHRRAGPDAVPDVPRRVVFDDFIHVLDTLRYLGSEGVDLTDVDARLAAGRVHRLSVSLRDGSRLGLGHMDRDSGSTHELLEVSGPGRLVRVGELATVEEHRDGEVRTRSRNEWASVGVQRGFAAMTAAFLQGVRRGETLSAADALLTHALCERVVRDLESRH